MIKGTASSITELSTNIRNVSRNSFFIMVSSGISLFLHMGF
jgi:hypothetical protein